MHPIIIGLAGRRGVGKSLIAQHLVEEHGFQRAHPFDGGKAACIGYFTHLGATSEEAHEMVFGRLKDQPSEILPGNATPRYFMERFGKFLGVQLGPDWTIGAEINSIIEKNPEARLVVESIVYEAPILRDRGGHVMMITRPSVDVVGLETDEATRAIVPDSEFLNDGHCIEDLHAAIDDHLTRYDLLPELSWYRELMA